MENDKDLNFGNLSGEGEGGSGGSAPRARNRTVMLTPEITGQVRARLQQDLEGAAPASGAQHLSATQVISEESARSPESSNFYTPGARGKQISDSQIMPAAPRAEAPVIRSSGNAHSAPQISASSVSSPGINWTKKTPVIGFLVSFDKSPNGEIFDLRCGRLIVTSEPAGVGNYLLVQDDSVSPMHAILRISADGEIQVLDQLSEFGTRVMRLGSDEPVELQGDKGDVVHGDIVCFGNRQFHVCLLARPSVAAE